MKSERLRDWPGPSAYVAKGRDARERRAQGEGEIGTIERLAWAKCLCREGQEKVKPMVEKLACAMPESDEHMEKLASATPENGEHGGKNCPSQFKPSERKRRLEIYLLDSTACKLR